MLISEIEAVNGQPDHMEPWLVAEAEPQIDINGEDIVVFADDGVIVWHNNERAWVEVTPQTLDSLLRRLDDDARDQRAEIVNAMLAHWDGIDVRQLYGGRIGSYAIMHDDSGVGHNWQIIYADSLPAVVYDEIENELFESDHPREYTASNGKKYRWMC